MTTPQFLITNILKKININDISKELYKKGVLSKVYDTENLILLYNKFDNQIYTDLQRECRSLIIEKDTLKIISYSCETPHLNNNALEKLSNIPNKRMIINKCYEGTYLSLFNYNNKWYISTRRCLHSEDSTFKSKSHFQMFEDIINKSKFENINNFTEKLNKNNSYYYILIHYENIHLIDYSSEFGDNYTKLCLTSIRDSNLNELIIEEEELNFLCNDIFITNKLDNITYENNIFNKNPKEEGLIIKLWNSNFNKYNLLKLQNINYQFVRICNIYNIYAGLMFLYQQNKLINYLSIEKNMSKITNYDTIGIIDGLFKNCTYELFELYKLLWSLIDGSNLNMELYKILPKEYKTIFYNIRGIYYKKNNLNINDIYNYLKQLQIDKLLTYIKKKYNILLHSDETEYKKIVIKMDTLQTKLFTTFVELL
jgi:hypothetical protein